MENLDTYKNAKEKADLEINNHLKNLHQYNEATTLSLAYLNDYLHWYKIKFKNKAGGYIQDAIILELKKLFGNNVDVKVIKKYLVKHGIISSVQIFIICVLILPLIASSLFYILVQLEYKYLYFIFAMIFLVMGAIFAGIWTESTLFRLYRIKEIKVKE